MVRATKSFFFVDENTAQVAAYSAQNKTLEALELRGQNCMTREKFEMF